MPEPRTVNVTIRLTAEERDAYSKFAYSRNFRSLSDFIRHATAAYTKGISAQHAELLISNEEMRHSLNRMIGNQRIAALNGEKHDPGALEAIARAIDRMVAELKRQYKKLEKP